MFITTYCFKPLVCVKESRRSITRIYIGLQLLVCAVNLLKVSVLESPGQCCYRPHYVDKRMDGEICTVMWTGLHRHDPERLNETTATCSDLRRTPMGIVPHSCVYTNVMFM